MKIFQLTLLLFTHLAIFSQAKIKNLQGQTVDFFEEISKLPIDKPVLVFTWANEYCSPCDMMLDMLQKEYAELKKKYGLRIIAINMDVSDNFPEFYAKKHKSSFGAFTDATNFVKKYKDKKGWTFDHYVDDQANLFKLLDIGGTPSALIFYNNKMQFRLDGFKKPQHFPENTNPNNPEVIQATYDTYLDVFNSFTALEQYFSENWAYSTKEDAYYKRNIVKIGEFFEITDSWITGEIKMRGLSLDVAGFKKAGRHKHYYKNGELEREVSYSVGKKHGITTVYNEKGIVIESSNWANDVLDGAYKEVDEAGGVFEGNFVNGKYDGVWKGTYPNGKPKVENVWKNGLLIEIKFYNDPNGNPLDKGTLTNGSGTRKVYNNKGILIRIETYEAGKFISEYEVK